MEKEALISKFHKELRQYAEVEGYKREATADVVRHISQFGEKSFIIASNLTDVNVEKVIEQEVNYFRKLNQPFEWKVYSYDKPSNLKERLAQQGFTIEDPEAVMVLKLEPQHALLSETTPLHLQEITDEQGIQDIVKLEDTIWHVSHLEMGNRLWRVKQAIPEALHLYGVYEDDQLVSAAWMYTENKSSFVSLWGGSTLPDYRGRGYYSALLAARAQKAFEQGYRYLTVDASPMSRPILEKFGFCCLAYAYPCDSPSNNS
ncbi:GNAT family N-acetyltransferase [Lysinibacillus parviboronicapiens]|uniref:GNAT family N-acetyltransferase n=1 Tax=Lysinibacillus parviboronicapiens TaxID=436516 RepID=UPI0006D0190E|nr:GNAT family N-acetyltransferase [Lysinibacillus parviboronicapiens]